MGHLTSRGWATKTPHITSAEAAAFRDRCQESHTAQWKADVTRWNTADGVNEVLYTDLPITGGRLVLDSSDPVRRQITLEIGGADAFEPLTPDDPLVPFGQWVVVSVRVDLADGSWSPWLKVFRGPIQTSTFERPSLMTAVEAADPAKTVQDHLHGSKLSYSRKKLANAINTMVNRSLPAELYDVEASELSQDTTVKNYASEAGQSRWECCNELAGKYSQEAFFDWRGDLIIRKDITDEDDDAWDPSEPGPDIGTVGNPPVQIRDGQGGNLVGITSTLTREGGVNIVVVNATALVNKRKKGHKHAQSKEITWTHHEYATGSVAYTDTFGRLPLVENATVHKLTPAVKAAKVRRAKKLLQRRRGLLRYLDIDVLPQYWAEPDDKCSVTWHGTTETHFLQRIEIDLAGGPMRVRTRTLAVKDPGDLG